MIGAVLPSRTETAPTTVANDVSSVVTQAEPWLEPCGTPAPMVIVTMPTRRHRHHQHHRQRNHLPRQLRDVQEMVTRMTHTAEVLVTDYVSVLKDSYLGLLTPLSFNEEKYTTENRKTTSDILLSLYKTIIRRVT